MERDNDSVARTGGPGDEDAAPEDTPVGPRDGVAADAGGGGGPKPSAWYKNRKIWLTYLGMVIVMAIVGLGVAIGCAMTIVNQMGFTSTGVARDSYASSLMSSTSRLHNGSVPHDSWVAWLQNIGRKGFTAKERFNIGMLGALAGAVGATLIFGCALSLAMAVQRYRYNAQHRLPSDGLPLISEME